MYILRSTLVSDTNASQNEQKIVEE